MNATVTWRIGRKLKGQICKTFPRKTYNNVKIVDHWNKLPASVFMSDTADSFES